MLNTQRKQSCSGIFKQSPSGTSGSSHFDHMSVKEYPKNTLPQGDIMADITIPGHLIVDTDPAFRNSLNTPKVSLSDNTPRENGVPPYPAVLTPVSPVEYDYQDLSLKTSNQYKTPNKLTVDAKYQFVLVPRGYRTIVVPEGSQTEVVTTKKMSHTQLISGGNSAGTPAPVSPPYQTSAQICTHPPLQKRQVTQKRIPRPANSFMTYRMDKQHEVLAQNPNANNRDISIIVGRMWRNESEEVKELYRQKAENGRKEHMLRYPNYKYVPAKKRKDQNAISNPLKKRGTLVDEGETPEEYIALAYWNMESPPLENYANVKLRPTYGPNVISQIPPKEGFQDQINYHFNQGNIGYAGGIGPHGSLTQYAPSDLFTYTSSARYPAPHQGGGGFDLNFASTPYTDSAASALGVSNLCSVQSLIPPRSDSIQNEDHYAFLPFLYQNPLFPQES